MSINFANVQRVTLSVVGSLFFATVFVGTAVVPAEASIVVTSPVR